MPQHLFTDNATNFKGTANQLKEWYRWIEKELSQKN